MSPFSVSVVSVCLSLTHIHTHTYTPHTTHIWIFLIKRKWMILMYDWNVKHGLSTNAKGSETETHLMRGIFRTTHVHSEHVEERESSVFGFHLVWDTVLCSQFCLPGRLAGASWDCPIPTAILEAHGLSMCCCTGFSWALGIQVQVLTLVCQVLLTYRAMFFALKFSFNEVWLMQRNTQTGRHTYR